MKNIVIDINIFMDFLFKREGHEKVAEVFKRCIRGELKGFVCAHEITTLHYFLKKLVNDRNKIRKSLSGIMKRFKIIETNEIILNKSLYSDIDDYEDAVIEVSASENNVEYILSRNIKDFKKSIVKAITPDELLAILNVRTKQKEIKIKNNINVSGIKRSRQPKQSIIKHGLFSSHNSGSFIFIIPRPFRKRFILRPSPFLFRYSYRQKTNNSVFFRNIQ